MVTEYANEVKAERNALRRKIESLSGFLTRIEEKGLVTSADGKAIIKNVREILGERN